METQALPVSVQIERPDSFSLSLIICVGMRLEQCPFMDLRGAMMHPHVSLGGRRLSLLSTETSFSPLANWPAVLPPSGERVVGGT